jgi:hypothetical protein
MRHVTLIGMNHVGGQDGLLPMTLTARFDEVQEKLAKLKSYGFQKAVVIRVDDTNPNLVDLTGLEAS